MGLSLIRTARSRSFCVGIIKVRPMYRFFMRLSTKGTLDRSAYPIAYAVPESGTEQTESAVTGASSWSFWPMVRRTSYTSTPSMIASARAK